MGNIHPSNNVLIDVREGLVMEKESKASCIGDAEEGLERELKACENPAWPILSSGIRFIHCWTSIMVCEAPLESIIRTRFTFVSIYCTNLLSAP